MPGTKKLARIHLISTSWFIFCVCYIVLVEMLKAGFQWWIVFSFSGYSILLLLFLATLYLFAIFRGISSSQKLDIEHPLTRTSQYAFFYVTSPFLGGLAGVFTINGTDSFSTSFLIISMGTLAATFVVWVIVDPVIGLLELLIPESRQHRALRLSEDRAEQKKKQRYNQQMLADIEAREISDRLKWQETFKPQAEKLAELLTSRNIDLKEARRQAADMAVQAWQTGGINCMRVLRDMAISKCREKNSNTPDFIQYWWDGIGGWRNPSLGS
jgi:hypothetical protein